MDAADETAAKLTPCSREKDGNVPCLCIAHARPAVAAALRERDTALEQERHFHELDEDRLRTALQRITALEADVKHWTQLFEEAANRRIKVDIENAELRASIAHPPLRAWSPK